MSEQDEQTSEAGAPEQVPAEPITPEPVPESVVETPEPEPVVAPDGSLANLLQEVQVLAEAHGISMAALHDALHESIGYRSS